MCVCEAFGIPKEKTHIEIGEKCVCIIFESSKEKNARAYQQLKRVRRPLVSLCKTLQSND